MLYANQVWVGAPGHVTKILQANNGQKFDLTNLNRCRPISISDQIKKWFVIFENTINHIASGYVRLAFSPT